MSGGTVHNPKALQASKCTLCIPYPWPLTLNVDHRYVLLANMDDLNINKIIVIEKFIEYMAKN